jgi:UDP-N-acetylmuramoyl-tripeptide--D-alanyl-D-alanine ligase
VTSGPLVAVAGLDVATTTLLRAAVPDDDLRDRVVDYSDDLPADTVVLVHGDDPRGAHLAASSGRRVVRFGLGSGHDVRADELHATAGGTSFEYLVDGERHPVALRLLGEHQVVTALAALAAAREVGIPSARAIAAIEAVPLAERWRMQSLDAGDGITIINDASDASGDSTAAALKALAQITPRDGRSVAVLGAVASAGESADEEHDRIGLLAVRLNIAQLVVVGPDALRIHASAGLQGSWDGESVFVADADAAYDLLRGILQPGDVALVKSSDAAGLRHLGDRLGGVS